MDKKIPLLLDPPHILPQDVLLTRNTIKCEGCGKVLGTPYYIFIGIPPSPCIIKVLSCDGIDNEKDRERLVLSEIQWRSKRL